MLAQSQATLARYQDVSKLSGGRVPAKKIAFDNTLWSGAVADPKDQTENTRALRALNDLLHRDERVTLSLLPLGDGVTLAMKR